MCASIHAGDGVRSWARAGEGIKTGRNRLRNIQYDTLALKLFAMASVAPQEIVFSTRFRIEGSDGKFRFSNVKRASSLDKDVPVGIYTEDGDVHTRQQSSNTKKDLATTFKDGQTTHVETTTTVTVKSITHPTNASEKKSVSSRQPLGVSDSAIVSFLFLYQAR